MPQDSSREADSALLTEIEAARFLAISPRTLWSLRQSGEIPHLRIGRAVRYSRASLHDWIDQRSRCGSSHGIPSHDD